MVLWVDKYRPRTLDKLDLHTKTNERLQQMVSSGDFPHIMFYGPSGAGKKTRVLALLHQMYGPGVEKIKVTQKTFKVKSKTVEITTMSSNYHIELNPSEVGNKDTLVIQEVIKEIAETHTVSAAVEKNKNKAFKVVVLNEVDHLSRGAQMALRRTMEKYMSTCRLILCCESACRVTGPLRSRVLPIRIPAPTEPQICTVLQKVASKEGLQLPHALSTQIAVKSGRNLRRALLMLEACKVDCYPFRPDQTVRGADWERFIDDLGRSITEEQSPQRLLLARNKLYELLTNCIPPEIIIKTLTTVLLKRLDDQVKHEVVRWAAYYEHRMQCGSKPIFHLEAFVAKFMSIYKRWIVEAFG